MAPSSNGRNGPESHPALHEYQLQDLNQPEPAWNNGHIRTMSDHGRRLQQLSRSRDGYSPIADSFQNAVNSPGPRRQLHIVNSVEEMTTRAASAVGYDEDDGTDTEAGDPLDIATAMSGLGFLPGIGDHFDSSDLPESKGPHDVLIGHNNDSNESFPVLTDADLQPMDDEDTLPLANPENQQSPGRRPSSTILGQNHNRIDHRVSWRSPSPRPARLGDDLEAGAVNRSSMRSQHSSASGHMLLSPSTPIRRAGTTIRNISQRVVNISSEPELAEEEMRRRLSDRQRAASTSGGDHARDNNATNGTLDGNLSQTNIPPVQSVKGRDHDINWFRNPKTNPFRGKSLGIFPPDSVLRARMCDLLIHPATEPLILLLIMVQTTLLAIQAADDNRTRQGSTWIDFALLGLFIIYTAEIIVRVIVSGFILNSLEYSTIKRAMGWRKALSLEFRRLFALPHDHVSLELKEGLGTDDPKQFITHQQSIINQLYDVPRLAHFKGDLRQKQRFLLARRAYLRHSWTRLDFLAVVSFWINFALIMVNYDSRLYIFSMMSSLRILRLLVLTSGTTIILRSLKKAAPLLLNVALLIGFFWLLFAIIGVQSFKSSLRRYCVWVGPLDVGNYTSDQYGNFQFCGGSTGPDNKTLPWVYSDGRPNTQPGKGYLCPVNSFCVLSDNPYNGTVSFDNIFQSLELVFVVMSSNTYTDLMYYLSDSDYLVVCLFFATGIVFMTLWLVNLLIAVITSSFQVIREESSTSAFANQAADQEQATEDHHDEPPRRNMLKEVYGHTKWLWIVVIVYSLVIQALRTATMSQWRANFISYSETAVTLALLVEIIFRFAADWRNFHEHKNNWVDLFLALATSIIQIPTIHNSGQVYAWLSFFQIVRIYRVVLAIKWTRELILLVLGNMSGLLNLILFVFLLTFLASILASELFRGTIGLEGVDQYNNTVYNLDPNGNPINITFNTIWNSFLGMYQVFSSENWTTLLYNITLFNDAHNTAWMGAIFLILWFILAFFIVLNMFIAVIQENFDVSEDEKRIKQFEAFLQRRELGASANPTLSLSALFRPGRFGAQRQDPLDYGPAVLEQLLRGATVQDFVGDNYDGPAADEETNGHAEEFDDREHRVLSFLPDSSRIGRFRTFVSKIFGSGEPNPFYARLKFSNNPNSNNPHQMAKAVFYAAEQRRQAQRDYLRRHPWYNVSLYIFKPHNKFRRLCQRLVGPGRGAERIEGAAPSTPLWYAFSAFLYASILAMVLLACVTTPEFQKTHFRDDSGKTWFTYADLGFAAIFTIEAAVRVVADGFFFAPHAYFGSSWGLIDGVVLITLWLNVLTALLNQGAVSRAVGAFKALRALRLLNVSDSARDTFHAVIVRGGWKVISAAFVSLSLLIPFAIYGLNLFNGQTKSCNDTGSGIYHLSDCINEYSSSPYNWSVVAPRQVANPYYSFDTFGDSLFILFQIVSQEGWVDVMWSAVKITGTTSQPYPDSRPGNAVFFVMFNLLGSVFVLTLFISVFMRNYTEQTGVAFLTAEQRSWLELRKRLRQLQPTKRPVKTKRGRIAKMCYNLAIRKNGPWQRLVTWMLLLHLVLLCTEVYSVDPTWEDIRSYIFFAFTMFYCVNLFIRLYGLTWARFRRNAWDVYSLFAIIGNVIVSILYFVNQAEHDGLGVSTLWETLHKLFLVSLVLLLIPRNNQLDQLFKTAAASLTAILNLLATWLVLFLVFAIAMTQTFGLTRFNSNETGNINFRDVPKALILLFRMSTGEGWNQIMTDFATVVPPLCTDSDDFLDSDCGSAGWAFALFIAWNILSMYIFVNMFISLIFESFSYVYQRSSGLAVVSRQELRRFKQAWAEYDPEGTGFIKKEDFPKLIGELSGVFEMRIYSEDYTVRKIIEECKVQERTTNLLIVSDAPEAAQIDLAKLNEKMTKMPLDEIRRRRRELNVFYAEVMHSVDPDRGINFTTLLMILAHYKIINDNKSLRLEEFLRRRRRLQYVEEDVQRAIVRSFLDTIHHRRKFRKFQAHRKSGVMHGPPQLQVPEIYVEDEDEQRSESKNKMRPSLTLSIPSVSSASTAIASGRSATLTSPGAILRQRGDPFLTGSPHASPTRPSFGSQPSPQLSPELSPNNRTRAISDISTLLTTGTGTGLGLGPTAYDGPPSPLASNTGTMSTYGTRLGDNLPHLSVDHGDTHRPRASSAAAPQGVWEALENSAWGQSIRRSISNRRPSTSRSGGSSGGGLVAGLGLGNMGAGFGLGPIGGSRIGRARGASSGSRVTEEMEERERRRRSGKAGSGGGAGSGTRSGSGTLPEGRPMSWLGGGDGA